MTLQFNPDINSAPLGVPLLLIYSKGNSKWGGNTGEFITEGIRKLDWYWEDYTGRGLWHANAKTSKNKILGWIKIEQVTY